MREPKWKICDIIYGKEAAFPERKYFQITIIILFTGKSNQQLAKNTGFYIPKYV